MACIMPETDDAGAAAAEVDANGAASMQNARAAPAAANLEVFVITNIPPELLDKPRP